MLILLRVVAGLLLALPLIRASAQPQALVEVSKDPPATVSVWNRPIIQLRATVNGASPAERAERARERILTLPPLTDPADLRTQEVDVAGFAGRAVFVRNAVLFFIFPQDVDPASGDTMDEVASATVVNLRAVLEARAQQSRPRQLLLAATFALLSLA